MKKLLSFSRDSILRIVYYICRSYVEWYFRFADLPFQHDIEVYLDVADLKK